MHGDRCSRPIIKPHTRLLVDELGNIKLISMQPIVHYSSVNHMLNNKTKLLASSLGCSHFFNVTCFSCAKIREPGDKATK